MELSSLLDRMAERKASDLHLAAGLPPIFRIDGALTPGDKPNLTAGDVDDLLRSALPEEKLIAAKLGRDFSATLRHGDKTFRCQVFCERGRLAAALRVIPERIPSLHELSLPPIVEKLTHLKRGLVLLTGPTGSGKTTTLVSMLQAINLTRSERICTVEGPMHYVLSSKLSLVTQRVVGEDVESYERGLLSAMNSDPDVILVGEIRTPETARLVLEMAGKGHLILSQITAESASDALNRLLGLLGEPGDISRRLLSQTVQAVIAQNLLQRHDRTGRVAANEILIGTPRVRQMIADGQTTSELLALAMEAGRSVGMQTMSDSLLALQSSGVVSREAVESLWKEKGRLPPGG